MITSRRHARALAQLPIVALLAACGQAVPPTASPSVVVTTTAAPTAATPAAEPPTAETPTAAATPSPSAPLTDPAAYVEGAPYAPAIDPAGFVAVVDNPYFPLPVGMRWTYRGGDERNTVEVLPETRVILGITATVVHDRVFSGGELTEDTFDWYAQDAVGNVWYLGERTEELQHGRVTSTEGSWEAGVDGAQPGIVMLAEPVVGETYRQEYLPGVAEDLARVLETGGSATVRDTAYDATLVTRDWTPLEPDIVEHKTYAPGIGVVLEELVKGGDERVELVRVETP
jgi:hypothetical protein